MTKEVAKWADKAMWEAEPSLTSPKVTLVQMTNDPLGVVASVSAMYRGVSRPTLADISAADRADAMKQISSTRLKAPFEFIKFHFLMQGVTRAFTHQLVRQRTAAYAQESMRFAVKEGMPTALPPSLAGTVSTAEWLHDMELAGWDFTGVPANYVEEQQARCNALQQQRFVWDRTVAAIASGYSQLVEMGMPAEDARGLAPTNVLTQVHYTTDLRNLLEVAGNRLCTQAQFEWRSVFTQIAQAIGNAYDQDPRYVAIKARYDYALKEESHKQFPEANAEYLGKWFSEATKAIRAEYAVLAGMFRPVCYATGKCEFMATFDRACSIRERVQANHEIGRPSSQWHEDLPDDGDKTTPYTMGAIPAIHPAEWLLDSTSARVKA